jgi:hypothetical protein
MINISTCFNSNKCVPELTGGLLMKEAIAPSRLRPKSEGPFLTSRGVFVSFIIENRIFWVQLKMNDISTKLSV